jgi:hypothetical protein
VIVFEDTQNNAVIALRIPSILFESMATDDAERLDRGMAVAAGLDNASCVTQECAIHLLAAR